MAAYRITQVRVATTADDPHNHITAVKLGDSHRVPAVNDRQRPARPER